MIAKIKRRHKTTLLLPELLEEHPKPWAVHESVLDHAAVDLDGRQAWVPIPGTHAQQLARLHEQYHIKVSPRNWERLIAGIIAEQAAAGNLLDARAVLNIAKMMEENRVDYMLWHRHRIDLRPCREALDWSKMTVPDDDPLEAACWVLQLAWTVWASVGFPKGKVDDPPPARPVDAHAKDYFDQCWKIVQQHNRDLAFCIIRACFAMYDSPSARVRDQGTAQIASYFPLLPPPELPPEKQEEKEEQEEFSKARDKEEKAQEDDDAGGTENPWSLIKGKVQLHDHTRGRRRPTVGIPRGYRPTDYGMKVRFPHRWTIDKFIFGRKAESQGSLMIDLSGSMKWNNDDLLFMLEHMPNIFIAGYSGVTDPNYYGRICIIAQNGVFNEYRRIDPECNEQNDIDLEALELLATKPEPRFWLSDGLVVGGRYQLPGFTGPGQLGPLLTVPWERLTLRATSYLGHLSDLIMRVNRLMKQANILRVPTSAVMKDVATRKRVVLYKTCTPDDLEKYQRFYGEAIPPAPYRYQL